MYEAYYVCVGCKQELDCYAREMYNGICPKCGHVTNGTVCATEKRSRQAVDIPTPWWVYALQMGFCIFVIISLYKCCEQYR